MTGREHYLEAERLIYQANNSIDVDTAMFYAEAQVHATLALAAATKHVAPPEYES